MVQDYQIVHMPIDDLQTWVLSGLRFIEPGDCWRGDEQATPLNAQAVLTAYVVLPGKYARVLSAGECVLALVDDVESISMASPQLTDEWRIRMEGLGESWLPLQFLPELNEPIKPARPVVGTLPNTATSRTKPPRTKRQPQTEGVATPAEVGPPFELAHPAVVVDAVVAIDPPTSQAEVSGESSVAAGPKPKSSRSGRSTRSKKSPASTGINTSGSQQMDLLGISEQEKLL